MRHHHATNVAGGEYALSRRPATLLAGWPWPISAHDAARARGRDRCTKRRVQIGPAIVCGPRSNGVPVGAGSVLESRRGRTGCDPAITGGSGSDNSPSMGQYQRTLAQAFPGFVDAIHDRLRCGARVSATIPQYARDMRASPVVALRPHVGRLARAWDLSHADQSIELPAVA
jgi:hypothetical protein